MFLSGVLKPSLNICLTMAMVSASQAALAAPNNTCLDIFDSRDAFARNSAISSFARDLEVDRFLNSLALRYSMSPLALSKLREGLMSGVPSGRSAFVRALIDRPAYFSAIEMIVKQMRGSEGLRQLMQAQLDKAKPTLSQIKSVYILISPGLLWISPFIIGPVGAVGFGLFSASIPGTKESVWLQRGMASFRLAKGQMGAAFGGVMSRVGDATKSFFGEENMAAAKGAMQQMMNGLSDQVSPDTRAKYERSTVNIIAEIEISYTLARMARDWKEAGYPVSFLVTDLNEDSGPKMYFENAFHPVLMDPSTNSMAQPLSFYFKVQSNFHPELPIAPSIMITGPYGAGKTTAETLAPWYRVLDLMGAPVPAEKAFLQTDLLETSIRSTGSLYDKLSHFQEDLQRLKEFLTKMEADPDQRAIMILDEPLQGGSERDRQKAFVEFLHKAQKYPNVLIVFATNSEVLIEPLKKSSFPILLEKMPDGKRVFSLGKLHETQDRENSFF